jgi:hypothetical protein
MSKLPMYHVDYTKHHNQLRNLLLRTLTDDDSHSADQHTDIVLDQVNEDMDTTEPIRGTQGEENHDATPLTLSGRISYLLIRSCPVIRTRVDTIVDVGHIRLGVNYREMTINTTPLFEFHETGGYSAKIRAKWWAEMMRHVTDPT